MNSKLQLIDKIADLAARDGDHQYVILTHSGTAALKLALIATHIRSGRGFTPSKKDYPGTNSIIDQVQIKEVGTKPSFIYTSISGAVETDLEDTSSYVVADLCRSDISPVAVNDKLIRCYSFGNHKPMDSGTGGGCVITSSAKLYSLMLRVTSPLSSLINSDISPRFHDKYDMYPCQVNELNAKWDNMLERKVAQSKQAYKILRNLSECSIPIDFRVGIYGIILRNCSNKITTAKLVTGLRLRGIYCSVGVIDPSTIEIPIAPNSNKSADELTAIFTSVLPYVDVK